MRAEFYRGEDADTPVGVARLDGPRVDIHSGDAAVRAAIARIFRLTPVVVDDASLRPLGSSGEAMLEPGSLEWFRAAAVRRAADEGLSVRLVPEAKGHGGWDPASAYRTFQQSVDRLLAGSPLEAEPQPGESRPEALPEAHH
ncbi:MAG: hypothetical protein M3Q23_11500 [Actinomycetota bacterium]|nr:hypothetical protein [Actinomycetota bacterium]